MQPRILRLALVVSILVNILTLGALFGGVAASWSRLQAPPRAFGRGRPIQRAGNSLPTADQARFRQTLAEVMADAAPLRRSAREQRRLAAELFVQPSFDRARVDAALGRTRDADFALRVRLEGAVTQFATTLPAPERAVLAQGLARGGPLRHPRAQANAPTS